MYWSGYPNSRCETNLIQTGFIADLHCLSPIAPRIDNGVSMRKFLNVAALVSAAALAAGCSSYNVSQPIAPISGAAKTDLKADVTVGEPTSGQSKVNILFGSPKIGGDSQFADGVTYGADSGATLNLAAFDPVSSAKAAAAYKAVKNSNADLIVPPAMKSLSRTTSSSRRWTPRSPATRAISTASADVCRARCNTSPPFKAEAHHLQTHSKLLPISAINSQTEALFSSSIRSNTLSAPPAESAARNRAFSYTRLVDAPSCRSGLRIPLA